MGQCSGFAAVFGRHVKIPRGGQANPEQNKKRTAEAIRFLFYERKNS
jgi:hypothetical protein